MKPGRELDALIAAKVFGDFCYPIQIPYFSTDISAAWRIVEKCVGFTLQSNTKLGTIHAQLRFKGMVVPALADATTAPHAICLAALEALKEKR